MMKTGDRVQIKHEEGSLHNQCGVISKTVSEGICGKTYELKLDNGKIVNYHGSWLKPTDLCAPNRVQDLSNALEMAIWVLEQRKHITDNVVATHIALLKKVLKGEL